MISVIIPIYNVEKYLESCLESIESQTYQDIEVLMVDDGSTDRSGHICEKFVERDNRFLAFHRKNEGISASRNFGLDQAKGDFICFIDSDDYIHPRMIETLADALSDEVSFSMVYGKRTAKRDERFDESIPPVTICDQDAMMRGLFGTSDHEIQYQAIWNKLFRRSLIADLRFKDIVAEDVEYMMRVYLRTDKVALIPQEMYYYYQRTDSITHQDTNSNNQIIRERFIHNLDTYYQIYTYIPESEKQYQAMALWKLYKRVFNVRYYAYSTPFKDTARSTIREVKNKTWHQAMTNSCLDISKKWIVRLLYHFPILYRLMMWWNKRRG